MSPHKFLEEIVGIGACVERSLNAICTICTQCNMYGLHHFLDRPPCGGKPWILSAGVHIERIVGAIEVLLDDTQALMLTISPRNLRNQAPSDQSKSFRDRFYLQKVWHYKFNQLLLYTRL